MIEDLLLQLSHFLVAGCILIGSRHQCQLARQWAKVTHEVDVLEDFARLLVSGLSLRCWQAGRAQRQLLLLRGLVDSAGTPVAGRLLQRLEERLLHRVTHGCLAMIG